MDLFKQPEVIVFIACTLIGLLSTIIGCIIWFVRLEGRLNNVEKSNDERALANVKIHDLLHARIDDAKTEYEGALKDVLRELNGLKLQFAELNGYLKKQKAP